MIRFGFHLLQELRIESACVSHPRVECAINIVLLFTTDNMRSATSSDEKRSKGAYVARLREET